jgi:hypothetical protein
MNPALATAPDQIALAETGVVDGVSTERLYDPVRERVMARRLRGARRRKLAVICSSVLIAAVAAGGFTLAHRDMVSAETASLAPAPAQVEAPALSTQPSLASSTSRSVQLPGTADSDPNKAQARVFVPEAERTASAAPAAPMQMQDQTAEAFRQIPLGGGRAADEAPALPSGALGFAPLPTPRPSQAP